MKEIYPKYQIVYLNGSTSSGKTTLSKYLQDKLLPTPFLHIGIDKIISMMPDGINNWTGGSAPEGFSWKTIHKDGKVFREICLGPFAKQIVRSYEEVVLTLAKQGHFLVIDDVSFGKKQVDQWRKGLNAYKVLWVGLHCPIEEIEQREKNRGNRLEGSGRHQHTEVHRGVKYDIELDTHKQSLKECTRMIKNALL